MSSPESLAEAVRTTLTATQGGFATQVGGKLYELEAPQNAVPPYMVYQVVSFRPERHFGKTTWHAELHMDLWAQRSGGSRTPGELEELLISELEQTAMTVSGLDRGLVLITNRYREPDEDSIRVSVDAEVIGTAS